MSARFIHDAIEREFAIFHRRAAVDAKFCRVYEILCESLPQSGSFGMLTCSLPIGRQVCGEILAILAPSRPGGKALLKQKDHYTISPPALPHTFQDR
jgi:hypothetical protein